MHFKHRVPISSLTTFQNEGQLNELVIVESEADLQDWLRLKKPYFILGKGSNTLINPEGACQTALQISPKWRMPVCTETQLTVGAGTTVNTLMKLLIEHGLSGLEFAAGVPASVGGMIAMNFGCWGQEIANYVKRVRALNSDGQARWVSQKDCQFSYRSSMFQSQPLIITEVEFTLEKQDPSIIKSKQLENIATRLAKQPLREKTFGSTFKNPPGYFAGALIEQVGFKGKVVGNALFSTHHANFLINQGEATYQDAVHLIQIVQNEVKDKLQIKLETEVKLQP